MSNQIRNNPSLLKWFNTMLANKDQNIENILTGDVDVMCGVHNAPWYFGPGQVRWDGVFTGAYPDQPDQTIALKKAVFMPWFRTKMAQKAAAKRLLHELSHWVEAYSLGRVWTERPSGYYDTGDYIESLIKW